MNWKQHERLDVTLYDAEYSIGRLFSGVCCRKYKLCIRSLVFILCLEQFSLFGWPIVIRLRKNFAGIIAPAGTFRFFSLSYSDFCCNVTASHKCCCVCVREEGVYYREYCNFCVLTISTETWLLCNMLHISNGISIGRSTRMKIALCFFPICFVDCLSNGKCNLAFEFIYTTNTKMIRLQGFSEHFFFSKGLSIRSFYICSNRKQNKKSCIWCDGPKRRQTRETWKEPPYRILSFVLFTMWVK